MDAKAQHYIPKFYLKGFTNKQGCLWVCEKFTPIRKSIPKYEAHRPDYYTHGENGERDETAENILQEIESRAAPVIFKLRNPQFQPSPEQMGHVYLFIAFMFVRVPSWREYLDKQFAQQHRDMELRNASDKDKFYKICADFEKNTGKPLGMDAEKLRQYVLRGEYQTVQSSIAFNLGSMFKSADTVAAQLSTYGYEVLYAPTGKYFLTSDSPVSTLQPDGTGQATIGLGFGWPGVQVHFPLNKLACLRLKKGIKPAVVEISERSLTQINRVTMANAVKYLFSPEGHRRISRLFDLYGAKIRLGINAFMQKPPQ